MTKSTIFLAFLCLVLATVTGFVIWLNTNYYGKEVPVVLKELKLALGLPGDSQQNKDSSMTANSALLWDTNSDSIKFENNAFNKQSIASITKLMTAMVALDYGFDWNKNVSIEPNEYVIGGQLKLAPDEYVTMRDLFYAGLMGSANNAILALVRNLNMPEEEFVLQMNRKAIELGLENTNFSDVTGLDPDNISTAYDVARMAEIAWQNYPAISEASSKLKYTYIIGGSEREHTILNTNNMITEQGYELKGSKTGYLIEAGFCLVVKVTGKKHDFIAVVLGANSEWDSMEEIKILLNKYEK